MNKNRKFKIKPKAGEFHVWTASGNVWVAWFKTEEEAKAWVAGVNWTGGGPGHWR